MRKPSKKGELTGLALIGVGFVLVGASLGGYLLGALVDRALGTSPRWAIVGLVLGTIAGFYDVYLLVQRVMRAPMPKASDTPPARQDPDEPEDFFRE